MKKGVIITFVFIILIIISFIYWQKSRGFEINLTNQNNSRKTPVADSFKTSEEVSSSTPFIMPEGEISRGNTNKKQVIFTFDCGSGINSADKILETAEKYNVKLTFFATGKFAEKYPETIKKISTSGHEIFNHTYSHPHLTQITGEEIKNELEKTEKIIGDLTGKTTQPFFRPPYGDRNSQVLEIAEKTGYNSVYWTFDALDWMPDKTAEQVKAQIYSKISPGAIVLMHVGDNITGEILDEVFDKIKREGYEIVNLNEGLK